MLSEKQRQAVETLDGPLLIVAGAGSGKTKCLVERTVNILVSKNIKPENIVLTTFTEKAARELQLRISEELRKKILF